ncbi:hypothetical protein L7F22_028909 [Adiantum nelumboides]|nr:hypothetical protein [Adiantum nelumboides]
MEVVGLAAHGFLLGWSMLDVCGMTVHLRTDCSSGRNDRLAGLLFLKKYGTRCKSEILWGDVGCSDSVLSSRWPPSYQCRIANLEGIAVGLKSPLDWEQQKDVCDEVAEGILKAQKEQKEEVVEEVNEDNEEKSKALF